MNCFLLYEYIFYNTKAGYNSSLVSGILPLQNGSYCIFKTRWYWVQKTLTMHPNFQSVIFFDRFNYVVVFSKGLGIFERFGCFENLRNICNWFSIVWKEYENFMIWEFEGCNWKFSIFKPPSFSDYVGNWIFNENLSIRRLNNVFGASFEVFLHKQWWKTEIILVWGFSL